MWGGAVYVNRTFARSAGKTALRNPSGARSHRSRPCPRGHGMGAPARSDQGDDSHVCRKHRGFCLYVVVVTRGGWLSGEVNFTALCPTGAPMPPVFIEN